jgi:hypothetical protein
MTHSDKDEFAATAEMTARATDHLVQAFRSRRSATLRAANEVLEQLNQVEVRCRELETRAAMMEERAASAEALVETMQNEVQRLLAEWLDPSSNSFRKAA